MHFAEIEAAWEGGNTVQYLVVIGYDDEWTDYTGKTKPQEQSGRLVWRVKPTSGVPGLDERIAAAEAELASMDPAERATLRMQGQPISPIDGVVLPRADQPKGGA